MKYGEQLEKDEKQNVAKMDKIILRRPEIYPRER